jgi:hypothetical protein
MRRLAGRIGADEGHDPVDDQLGQRWDARRARLVVQPAIESGPHEALPPAPDNRLSLAGLPHDRRRAQAIGGVQHDTAAPSVRARDVPLGFHRLQNGAFDDIHCHNKSFAHLPDYTTACPWESSNGLIRQVASTSGALLSNYVDMTLSCCPNTFLRAPLRAGLLRQADPQLSLACRLQCIFDVRAAVNLFLDKIKN